MPAVLTAWAQAPAGHVRLQHAMCASFKDSSRSARSRRTTRKASKDRCAC